MTKKNKKNLHVKPTKEELEANAQKAAKEVEELLKNEEEIPEEQENEEEPKKDEEDIQEEENEPENGADDEKPQEEEDEEPSDEPDYKKKFIESTKEAQVLFSSNKKFRDALDKASSVKTPTDQEMQEVYPDWEFMDDTQKKLAIKQELNDRKFAELDKVTQEFKQSDVWLQKVNKFLDDPQTLIDRPELEGKQEEFRLFVSKPTRRGVDFADLVNSFLFEIKTEPKPKKKKQMMETGSAGANNKGKQFSNKISIEQARKLRNTDYKKYQHYLKNNMIEDSL